MKISSSGLQKIADRIDDVGKRLNGYMALPKLSTAQREDFCDLQEQLRTMQKQYRAFSDPESGT